MIAQPPIPLPETWSLGDLERMRLILRGSSVTGHKWGSDEPFDADGSGTSDLDVTFVGGDMVTLFREFHLPQAALRLRQGFGRLIRARTDRGAVVLLDRRALLRDYGAELLAALPDARVRRVPRDAIGATVALFCER